MACFGSKVSQVRIYSIKAEEDFPKVSDTTEAKAMLDTVREFCNRFFFTVAVSNQFLSVTEQFPEHTDFCTRDIAGRNNAKFVKVSNPCGI